MKPDQERVRSLLTDTIALLCKNGLHFSRDLRVQGLLGVTVDGSDVFIVHIDELIDASAKAKYEVDIETDSEELNAVDGSASDVACADDNERARDTSSVVVAGSSGSQRRKRKASSPLRIDTSAANGGASECNDADSEWSFERTGVDKTTEMGSTSPPLSPRVKIERVEEGSAAENVALYGISVKIEEPTSDDDTVLIEGRNGIHHRLRNSQDCSEQNAAHRDESLPCIRNISSIFPRHRYKASLRYSHVQDGEIDAALLRSQISAQQLLSSIQNTEQIPLDISPSVAVCSSYQSNLSHVPEHPTINAAAGAVTAAIPRMQYSSTCEAASFLQRSPPTLYSAEWAVQRLLSWSRGRGSHMIRTPVRRKRYECTLNDCGRQYLNTFDLYRHQRQKHMMPPDFYQQGKKQTFGIREVIDPGSSQETLK